MRYCSSSTKATVNYKINGTAKQFIAYKPLLPIDVILDDKQEVNQNFIKNFDGTVLSTYPFTISAPAEFSRKREKPQIYLIGGTWDDCGSIGSFASPCVEGRVYTYSGEQILIGSGFSVNGSVTNLVVPQCNVNLNIKWLVELQTLRIYDKNNNLIFIVQGKNISFDVACDDDCPPGHIKCTHDKYPGYCCIPCQETAAKINNLAAKARCCNG